MNKINLTILYLIAISSLLIGLYSLNEIKGGIIATPLLTEAKETDTALVEDNNVVTFIDSTVSVDSDDVTDPSLLDTGNDLPFIPEDEPEVIEPEVIPPYEIDVYKSCDEYQETNFEQPCVDFFIKAKECNSLESELDINTCYDRYQADWSVELDRLKQEAIDINATAIADAEAAAIPNSNPINSTP